MPSSLSRSELIDWIRLTRTSGIGLKTFRQLIGKFGSPSEAIARFGE